jgi:prolyl-tRNA synthetase
MRWSATLIPTLKEAPSEAVALSHKLMLRAGLVRQVGSGAFAYLPLGWRSLNKIISVVRDEMDRAGAIELHMPALWPRELLDASGRLEVFGEDLFRMTDRHGRACVLAPTHEEVVTAIVRDGLRSYRQLPVNLYQIQTKFRDEPRPRFGVLRTREFLMKDAYSFSMDEGDLDRCYEQMHAAYCRIFDRCGLDYVVVEAESGAMGGSASHEFLVRSLVGSDTFARCVSCGYAANVACAAIPPLPPAGPPFEQPALRQVETPGRSTIEAVSEFLGVAAENMIKTIIYVADGRPVAALVRGDHDVNEAKLARALGAASLELADSETVEDVTGAPVGFAGPVGLNNVPTLADHAAAAVAEGVTGANKADMHLVGVVPGRDFEPGQTANIRNIAPGDACCRCGKPITLDHGIEVGHLFKLGTKYSSALGAMYLGPAGTQRPYVMGCYGIGINRVMAALIESAADEDGIVWPPALAPYEVEVLPLDMSEDRVVRAAEGAYARLKQAGVDVILDDRDERPGAKFKDADLVGIPLRVVIGKGFLKRGELELQVRVDKTRRDVSPDDLTSAVGDKLTELGRNRFNRR